MARAASQLKPTAVFVCAEERHNGIKEVFECALVSGEMQFVLPVPPVRR